MRISGHKLTVTWSGEHGKESSSTGTCLCGKWEESGSSQMVVREEYRHHLRKVKQRQNTGMKNSAKMTHEELSDHSREVHWLPDDNEHGIMLVNHDFDHTSGAVKTAPKDKVHTHAR